MAQDLPDCIKKLNKKNSLTTTKFERIIPLKGDRTVYEFSVNSVAQCMDCSRGTIFYDENCNEIASFIMGRGASGFVAYGYTAGELGKAGFPNIKYGVQKDPLPQCMESLLANTDSLNKAGIGKIVQVRIKDKILYGFEHQIDPKLANCKDCSTSIVYYNADCKPEVTFRVGGIAGVQGEKGYTATDFMRKTLLSVLWSAKKITGVNPPKTIDEPKTISLPESYIVGKNWLPEFGLFKSGDRLYLSSRNGLKHFRNGKQLNTYKIIPLQLTEYNSAPAKLNVILSKQHQVFYLEPFERYFKIVDNSFLVTKVKYLRTNALTNFKKGDWTSAFDIK